MTFKKIVVIIVPFLLLYKCWVSVSPLWSTFCSINEMILILYLTHTYKTFRQLHLLHIYVLVNKYTHLFPQMHMLTF